MSGFYYWRGRVLVLTYKGGQYTVRIPTDLLERWRADVAAGRITPPTQ